MTERKFEWTLKDGRQADLQARYGCAMEKEVIDADGIPVMPKAKPSGDVNNNLELHIEGKEMDSCWNPAFMELVEERQNGKVYQRIWGPELAFGDPEAVTKYEERKEDAKAAEMSGYMQAVLMSSGCYTGARYCVRNVDRWYCEVVESIFGTTIYSLKNHEKEYRQWVIKSAKVNPPKLTDVVDFRGFCRAYIELHGIVDIVFLQRSRTSQEKRKMPRLRIYGKEEILRLIMNSLPAGNKKIQRITNKISGGYTGRTCAIYYQSGKEIEDILEYISGEPRNAAVWDKWREKLSDSNK